MKQVGWQSVDWDAVISPLKVFRVQTGVVAPEDKEKTCAPRETCIFQPQQPHGSVAKLNADRCF